jgi:protoheme IX farnesyltransferase
MSRKDWMELLKVRIVFMSLLMAALGYFLNPEMPSHWTLGLWALLGIALVGGSCGVLNEVWEKDIDAKMHRTRHRPIPTGKISVSSAMVLGVVLGAVGLTVLFTKVNTLTGWLGLSTLVSYVLIYTPLKQISTISTLVGAIPGALPPLLGWTSASGTWGLEGLILFGIVFFWQIPHFLAIAWMYREDYARAGLPILPVVDKEGVVTSRQVLLYLVALIPISIVPGLMGVTGAWYFFGALVLGGIFLFSGYDLAMNRDSYHARRLFFVSLLYLPILSILMAWDHV